MMYLLKLTLLLAATCTVYTNPGGFADIDDKKFEEGRQQYALMELKTKMPEYGQCWKDAIVKLQKGCKELSDVMQTRLALAYLNCFNRLQGRPAYMCEWEQPINTCLTDMSDVDRMSFTTFFTHTQNICYFLESQVWHEQTEETINRLATSSEDVASQLEESSQLQFEIIRSQNDSLKNQEQLLNQADNLSHIISSSSDNIHVMFEEFKTSTQEQRMLINDVFDRVARLQSMVLGEFSGFYSIVFYTLSVLICYLLTSAPRTASARFWLFGIMTVNMIAERMIVSWAPSLEGEGGGVAAEADCDEAVYLNQWLCRKISGGGCLVVLIVSACRYKDLNVVNNQLLVEIRKQNSELKHFLLGSTSKPVDGSHGNRGGMISSSRTDTPRLAQPDTTGYESDSAVSGCSNISDSDSGESDHTFLPAESYSDDSDTESCCSALTDRSSHSGMPAITRELSDLRNSTPLRELASQISTWAQTGFYGQTTAESPVCNAEPSSSTQTTDRGRHSRSATPVQSTSKVLNQPRYFLRPRTRSRKENPVVTSESSKSFTKTVRHLEHLAVKNSRMMRYKIERQHAFPDTSDDDH